MGVNLSMPIYCVTVRKNILPLLEADLTVKMIPVL